METQLPGNGDELEYQELHELIGGDPVRAWPRVAAFIDSLRGSPEQRSDLLEDIVHSDSLPQLINELERVFHRSTHFQKHLMWAGDGLGGRGGPEMDRIWRLVNEAERRHRS